VDADLQSEMRVVCSPNPAREQTSISLTLDRPMNLNIDVVDALGQRVAVVMTNSPFGQGQHNVSCPLSTLPAGAYFVRIASSRSIVSIPLVVAQ
jgi:hypothetical protein